MGDLVSSVRFGSVMISQSVYELNIGKCTFYYVGIERFFVAECAKSVPERQRGYT